MVALPVTFFLFLAFALSFPNSTSPIPEDVFGFYGLATLVLVGAFEVAFRNLTNGGDGKKSDFGGVGRSRQEG